MIEQLESGYRTAAEAAELIFEHVASIDPWWVAAGMVLHLLSQLVRQQGWRNILRAAYPQRAADLRLRDVAGAYFAGAGLNGVVPARGGDVVKLYLLRRRIEGSSYATLAATFVPETLFETACGIGLVIWALAHGWLPVPTAHGELPSLDVSFLIAHPVLSTIVAAGLTIGAVLVLRRLRRTMDSFVARLRRGLAILERPRDYFTQVVPWQALGRVVRLASLACLMKAFALPVTLATVILVMAAQGGTRIIPVAPASAGLRVAMLAYGLVEITDKPVDAAAIAAYSFGVGALQLAVGLVLSILILLTTVGSFSPGRLVAAARAHAAAAKPSPDPGA